MNADEFTLIRHFEVPRERVFEAFTDPEIFRQWFGPETHPVQDCAIDAKPGGLLRIAMVASDQARYPVVGQFTVVDPLEHLAFTLATFPIPGGDYGFECSIAISFWQRHHRTLIEMRYKLLKAKPEHQQAAAASREGWEQSLDRLRNILERA